MFSNKEKIIRYKGKKYPAFQKEGYASQFAIPFAKKVCIGHGLDVGCMKKEWAFPGSVPIDKDFGDGFDALHLPSGRWDYIFSSH